MTVDIIPVVIDALGSPSRKLKEHLRKIGIETSIVNLQKTHLLCRNSPKNSGLVRRVLFTSRTKFPLTT